MILTKQVPQWFSLRNCRMNGMRNILKIFGINYFDATDYMTNMYSKGFFIEGSLASICHNRCSYWHCMKNAAVLYLERQATSLKSYKLVHEIPIGRNIIKGQTSDVGIMDREVHTEKISSQIYRHPWNFPGRDLHLRSNFLLQCQCGPYPTNTFNSRKKQQDHFRRRPQRHVSIMRATAASSYD